MNMLSHTKDAIERKLATPRGKGYTSLANAGPVRAESADHFYDEQLRSDGWHLDEVDDDDDLDFTLPPSRPRGSDTRCPPDHEAQHELSHHGHAKVRRH